MQFNYRAKQRNGLLAAGALDAGSLAEARAQLRAQGMFLLSLEPAGRLLAVSPQVHRQRTGRVTKGELVTMMSELTIMCQSGVDLAESLRNLAGNCRAGALKTVLQQVCDDVATGASFSVALRKHPSVFDGAFVAAIAAGEQTGKMVNVLERLTMLLRSEKRLSSSIWAMLTYPILLCLITSVVIAAMLFFVLPQFAEVFAGFDHPAPPLTQLLLDLGAAARRHWLALLVASVAGGVGLAIAARSAASRQLANYLLMHLVVIRKATRTLVTGRSFQLLGTMLQSGVPLLEGIRLCRSASRNAMFRNLFELMERELVNGQGISSTLFDAAFLPSGAAQMIATAERSGKLGPVLQTVGQYYEEEGESCVRALVKLIEPVLIIGLGLIVGTVVLSVMLPLFDASTMAH